MTLVSNDPASWPIINLNVYLSYLIVAAGVLVVYDWVLTLGREIELIWRQRWSLMTALYLVIRYVGIPYSVINVLLHIPLVSKTDEGCNIMNYALNGTDVVVAVMLGVIMIARLHAMYQGSRTMLIFLIIIFLAITIAWGVLMAISLKYTVTEELILSGTYMCEYSFKGDVQLLISTLWVLYTVWEVLALCLSFWIALKHFRDLRRLGPLTRLTIRDCFRVLVKSHVLYFVSFVGVSCFKLVTFSPELENSNSMRTDILNNACQIFLSVQMYVLGPSLILSVREYHAKLVAESDTESSISSISFQEHVHVQTSSTV